MIIKQKDDLTASLLSHE